MSIFNGQNLLEFSDRFKTDEDCLMWIDTLMNFVKELIVNMVRQQYSCLCLFLEKKKYKILGKNLGFYACSRFLSGTHGINPSFSAKRNPQHCCGFLCLFWISFCG